MVQNKKQILQISKQIRVFFEKQKEPIELFIRLVIIIIGNDQTREINHERFLAHNRLVVRVELGHKAVDEQLRAGQNLEHRVLDIRPRVLSVKDAQDRLIKFQVEAEVTRVVDEVFEKLFRVGRVFGEDLFSVLVD